MCRIFCGGAFCCWKPDAKPGFPFCGGGPGGSGGCSEPDTKPGLLFGGGGPGGNGGCGGGIGGCQFG